MQKTQTSTADSSDLELGKLYLNLGDIDKAIQKLALASESLLKSKNFAAYFDCQRKLLRIYAEREDFDAVNNIKEKLQDLVLKEGVEISSRTLYTLGICADYKGQKELALDYYQKSLASALAADHKEDMSYAIFGIASIYMQIDKLTESLKEIYNLQVFFEVLKLPELQFTTKLLNAVILRRMGRFEQALEVFWSCYEELKEVRNLPISGFVLYGLGAVYKEMGDRELARVYLTLAQKTVHPINQKHLYRDIEARLQEMGVSPDKNYDLLINSKENAVFEKRKGKVDFKSQFILLDLLNLFVKNPGVVFSKEQLASKIWSQNYNPAVHDNKIYVTIKRLRELIEPDQDKPKYIFRAKNGYYINKSAKIMVQ